jgi:hypothetical protein
LRAQLVAPALVDIEQVPYSQAELGRVQAEVSRLVREIPNRLESLGDGYQHVSLDLRADGMEFAQAISRRFGDRVRVRVGGCPYPPDGFPLPVPKPPQATRAADGTMAGALTRGTPAPGFSCVLGRATARTSCFYGGTAAVSGDRYSTAPGKYDVLVVVPIHDGVPGGQILSEPAVMRVR